MKQWFRKHPVPVVCAALLLLLTLCMAAGQGVLQLQHKLEEREVQIADFTPLDLEVPDAHTLITAGADPRLVLEAPGVVRNVSVQAEFSADPGEFVLYYALEPDAFTERQKVYASYEGGGRYVFELPYLTGPLAALRLDFGVIPSITVQLGEIRLNGPSGLSAWCRWLAAPVFYTIAAGCIVQAAAGTAAGCFQKKQKK